MQEQFFSCADELITLLHGDEVLLVNYSGEQSDFVRFNAARVRQAGKVNQHYLTLRLIRGARHAAVETTISGVAELDRPMLRDCLEDLRARLGEVPEDPYLLYATEVNCSELVRSADLPDPGDVLDAVCAAGDGHDAVGLYASGPIYSGFANSFGQRNWFQAAGFHLDSSFYANADKAVKCVYAGLEWDRTAFARKVAAAESELDVIRRPARTIAPGEYRVYLAPSALKEIIHMLGWGGFSIRAHRTGTTPLLRLVRGEAVLARGFTVRENTREGLAPAFSSSGFVKPELITLIENGRYRQALVSPRSSREYGVATTGGGEYAESLDISGGELAREGIPRALDTGLYINTLWYLHYSDRSAGRITGMTRFATFWVEGGRIVDPVNVMRFDETVYRMLGSELAGLTREREFFPTSLTYFARNTDSIRLPGALVDRFRFTL